MNTLSKRTAKILSLCSTYAMLAIGLVFVGSFFEHRRSAPCTPTIHKVSSNRLEITPNVNLEKAARSYNTKEIYLMLVQQKKMNGNLTEREVWSTLVKKKGIPKLTKKLLVLRSTAHEPPFTDSTFVLRATYFPYIGLVKTLDLAAVKT